MMKQKIEEIDRNIRESKTLTVTTKNQLKMYLSEINKIQANPDQRNQDDSVSSLEVFKWFVAKEKAIYAQLNLMK
jgi:hypothetical protein